MQFAPPRIGIIQIAPIPAQVAFGVLGIGRGLNVKHLPDRRCKQAAGCLWGEWEQQILALDLPALPALTPEYLPAFKLPP